MPGITTNDNVQQTTDEKPKLAEQIDLEEAETALAGKDYKTARELLEKLGKIPAVSHIPNFRDAAGDGYLHPEMISSGISQEGCHVIRGIGFPLPGTRNS